MNHQMSIISDSRTWSGFDPQMKDPLNAHLLNKTPPNMPVPHPTTGKQLDNQNFLRDFQSEISLQPESKSDSQIQDLYNFGDKFNPYSVPWENANDSSWFKADPKQASTQTQQSLSPNVKSTQTSPSSTPFHQGIRDEWTRIENIAKANSFSNDAEPMTPSTRSFGVDDAAKLAQQVGENGVGIYSAIQGGNADAKYFKNATQPGTHAQLHANMIKSQQDARTAKAASYGKMGSLFGPVGAAIGTAIGHFTAKSGNSNSNDFKTAYSSSGKVNPQDSGIVAGNSTASASGTTQQQE